MKTKNKRISPMWILNNREYKKNGNNTKTTENEI